MDRRVHGVNERRVASASARMMVSSGYPLVPMLRRVHPPRRTVPSRTAPRRAEPWRWAEMEEERFLSDRKGWPGAEVEEERLEEVARPRVAPAR